MAEFLLFLILLTLFYGFYFTNRNLKILISRIDEIEAKSNLSSDKQIKSIEYLGNIGKDIRSILWNLKPKPTENE